MAAIELAASFWSVVSTRMRAVCARPSSVAAYALPSRMKALSVW